MGVFYILFALFPYVIGQAKERWLRRISKRWKRHPATVLTQTLRGVWLTTLEIHYQMEVDGESHAGLFQRRYLNRSSAEAEPVFESNARIEVLIDPANPLRSYFPLPLSGWGLVLAAPFVALVAIVVLTGLYARFGQWQHEMKNRIPETEWRPVRYSPLFDISLPCKSPHLSGSFPAMTVQGQVPYASMWLCQRRGLFFDAVLLDYPVAPSAEEVFAYIRKLNGASSKATETPLQWQNLRTGQALTWPGSTGRLYQRSGPDYVMELFVAKNSVYLISTNWDVPSDVRLFFESMHPLSSLK
ncbi:MAG TPA: hypothetical protein VHC90_25140 [Bryobacteraceae bacterium]|nr:hypothetical protein [Bryobacteraceae bacterium]